MDRIKKNMAKMWNGSNVFYFIFLFKGELYYLPKIYIMRITIKLNGSNGLEVIKSTSNALNLLNRFIPAT